MNATLARERLHDVAAIIESRAVTPSTAAQMIRDIANDLPMPEGNDAWDAACDRVPAQVKLRNGIES